MTSRIGILLTLPLLLVTACQNDDAGDGALELRTCSPEDSPRELLRLDGTASVRPYDLIDGVSVVPATPSFEEGAKIVDNCGGAPIKLENSYGYPSAAAYVDGEVVLCGVGVAAADEGIWALLGSGARGKKLDVAESCTLGLESSFGVVESSEGLVQYLPGGGVRSIPSVSRPALTWLGDAGVVRGESSSGGVVVLPPDGAEAIVVEGLPPIEFVVTQGNASPWVFLAAYTDPAREPSSTAMVGTPDLFALDLVTGSWFETGIVDGNGLLSRNFASVNDGLAAVVDHGLEFWRPSWGAALPGGIAGALGVTVIDGERVIVATDDGLQLVRVPQEQPDTDAPTELEVVWSRPLEVGQPNRRSAGVPWKDVLLVETGAEVWAYPLDGSDPYAFLPSLGFAGEPRPPFPTLGYTYLGTEFVTAIARNPDDPDTFQLFRNRIGGEVEVLDTDIDGPRQNDGGFIAGEGYRWTPQLGRILYVVREADGLSVRQHVLTD
jgi:hypothetical protein